MNVVITGATGLLGREVLKIFKEDNNFNTTGTGFSRASGEIIKIDLTDRTNCSEVLDKTNADIVVHCAAERRPDNVTKENLSAAALNISSVEYLAEEAEKRGFYLIYISTDYVFDGTKPPYSTKALPNPLNLYGIQKLEGEKKLLHSKGLFTILRVPILYGPLETLEESPVTQIASQMRDGIRKFDNKHIRYPTLTTDIAHVCRDLSEMHKHGQTKTGIRHFSGQEPYTKYEIAQLFAPLFKIETSEIEAGISGGATRPENAHLDTSKLEKELNLSFSSFKDSFEKIITPFLS
jgi:dTDP-4-dehydrorhamnose reductase